MVKRWSMPTYEVRTAHMTYPSVVERGVIGRARDFLPTNAGTPFIVSTSDVWALHGARLETALARHKYKPHVLFFPGGEANKRFAPVETLAEQMIELGGDRTSVVIGFGGGITTDVAGFLAAIFMRGVPVLQIPTTLLAQVDAAVGGKTGVNLINGKNLIGSFHQPIAVLVDPEVTATLPEREFRAGLYEVIKCGVIRDRQLFETCATETARILAMEPELVDQLIAAAVRIKAEVVSADERESNLRRILHAMEAETGYTRFLHGEAVAWGMIAATHLAVLRGTLCASDASAVIQTVLAYGALPPASDLDTEHLIARLASDKKTLQGKVHFVLPKAIGEVEVVSGIEPDLIRQAIVAALQNQQRSNQT
jgi:3-dehydroquinate synthase